MANTSYLNFNVYSTTTETKMTVRATGLFTRGGTKGGTLKWSYYPSGSPKSKTVIKTVTINPGTTMDERTVRGLLPGKEYIVEALLTETSTKATFTKTVSVRTERMHGTFTATSTAPSTVSTLLSGLSTYSSYDIEVDFNYKKRNKTSWIKHATHTIPKGKNMKLRHLYTGLAQKTVYDFHANCYKVVDGKRTLMNKFSASTVTATYIPDSKPRATIVDVVEVPGGRKSFIEFEVDKPLGDTFTVHAYRSTDGGETWTDRGAFSGRYIYATESTVGARLIRLGVVDANQQVWNYTEPIQLEFPSISFPTYVQGQPMSVSAEDIKKAGDAILKAHEYRKYIKHIESAQEYYDELSPKLTDVEADSLIEGGDTSVLDLIGEMAGFMADLGDYDVGEPGTPITASSLNTIFSNVLAVLSNV